MRVWNTVRNARGLSFVSILLALVIIGALYFGYFRMSATKNEKAVGIQSIQVSKAAACRTQRQQVERDIQSYMASHDAAPGSLGDLERDGIRIPNCPEGGRYALAGTHVTCSVHQ
jgi:competence protein ComGC